MIRNPGFRIRIHLISILGWKPIRIQGFDDQKLKKIYSQKIIFFFIKKLQFTFH